MLTKFFITCNKVGFFTLGGGYAMIPIMEQEFVDKNHWLERQEFMDIMVVAQATPGIFSIDMASHIGYKLRGTWGGIVGALGIALPSIICIILIAAFFPVGVLMFLVSFLLIACGIVCLKDRR